MSSNLEMPGVDVPFADGTYSPMGQRYRWLDTNIAMWWNLIDNDEITERDLGALASFLVLARDTVVAARRLNVDGDAADSYALTRIEDLALTRLDILADWAEASGAELPPDPSSPKGTSAPGTWLERARVEIEEWSASAGAWKWVGVAFAGVLALLMGAFVVRGVTASLTE